MRKRLQDRALRMQQRSKRFFARVPEIVREITFDRLLKGLSVVVAIPLIIYVFLQVKRDVLIIDPFTVPKWLEDAGLTPQVMANRVGYKMEQMEKTTRTYLKKDEVGLEEEGRR